METIYYSLDAKRLTVCGEAAGRRASGGQETVCYAFVPRPRRLRAGRWWISPPTGRPPTRRSMPRGRRRPAGPGRSGGGARWR